MFNDFWQKPTKKGTIQVGFTRNFLDRVGIIWNLVPSVTKTRVVQENSVVFAMETSKCMNGIKSPVGGILERYNQSALDQPDNIDESMWIYEVNPNKESLTGTFLDEV